MDPGMAAIAQQERLNRLAAGYYGISLAGLIAIPVFVHSVKSGVGHKNWTVLRPVQRLVVGLTFGNVLVMPVELLLVLLFIGLNIGLTSWKMKWTEQAYLGSRIGWLAICNMCLAVILGMKNTPLTLVAGQTYRDLNSLHRACGYTTIIEVILHGALFSSGLYQHHAPFVLRQPIVYAGAVAGIAMLLIGLTANGTFRKRFYEAFYLLHLLLVAIALVAVGLHQPWIGDGALIVTIIAASFWVIDRSIRLVVWAVNARYGFCVITPLPLGATRVVFENYYPAGPGSHALLWIPSIRIWQQHPFSVLNDGETECVITARNGFTRSLHEAACKTPGMRIRASLDGPYGITPDLAAFNKCLIIAGGSGATFAMSLAHEWLRLTSTADTERLLHFVWVVRSSTHFEWLGPQLRRLQAHPRVLVMLYVTGSALGTKNLADGEATSGDTSPSLSQSREDSRAWLVPDVEKAVALQQDRAIDSEHRQSHLHHCFCQGRPMIDEIFSQVLGEVSAGDRLLVTGSGPAKLLTDIRAATADKIKVSGPSIKLHIEEYEW